jgi:hypothetical protein
VGGGKGGFFVGFFARVLGGKVRLEKGNQNPTAGQRKGKWKEQDWSIESD